MWKEGKKNSGYWGEVLKAGAQRYYEKKYLESRALLALLFWHQIVGPLVLMDPPQHPVSATGIAKKTSDFQLSVFLRHVTIAQPPHSLQQCALSLAKTELSASNNVNF